MMANEAELREEDTTMLKEQKEIYTKTMSELWDIWHDNNDELRKLHGSMAGIRSTQIGALVILLIKKGILK